MRDPRSGADAQRNAGRHGQQGQPRKGNWIPISVGIASAARCGWVRRARQQTGSARRVFGLRSAYFVTVERVNAVQLSLFSDLTFEYLDGSACFAAK